MLQQLGQLPMGWLLIALIAVFGSAAFFLGRVRAERLLLASPVRMHSRPNYHGYYVAMCSVVPVFLIAVVYAVFAEDLTRGLLSRELPSSFARISLPPRNDAPVSRTYVQWPSGPASPCSVAPAYASQR